MRTEVDHHLLLASAKDQRVGQSGHTGDDFDRATTSVVEDSIVESPPVDIPRPAGDGAVDQGRPEEHEDHERKDSTTFGDGSSGDGGSGGTELQLRSRVSNVMGWKADVVMVPGRSCRAARGSTESLDWERLECSSSRND